jgi:argonaute-like protein implicated in RNA metabolism and viral defense
VNPPAIRCSYTRLADPEKLKLNPKNPNAHPARQLKVYAKVLRHQGWRKAIVVSWQSGMVVTGAGATLTAIGEGWNQVPVDDQDFDNPAQELAHLVADNKLPQLSDQDEAGLHNLMVEDLVGVDHELLGITLESLESDPPRPAKEDGETASSVTCPHCGKEVYV